MMICMTMLIREHADGGDNGVDVVVEDANGGGGRGVAYGIHC